MTELWDDPNISYFCVENISYFPGGNPSITRKWDRSSSVVAVLRTLTTTYWKEPSSERVFAKVTRVLKYIYI